MGNEYDPGVYFLGSPSSRLIKIGQSGDVGNRVYSICQGAAERLQVVAVWRNCPHNPRRTERMLHQFFATQRVRGEWFRISENDVRDVMANWDIVEHEAGRS